MSTFYKIIKLPLACFFLIYTTTPDDKIAYLLLLHAIVTFIRHHYYKFTVTGSSFLCYYLGTSTRGESITHLWVEDAIP